MAHHGVLFLDELATLSMGAQERLLRAVEYGEVSRIGSSKPIRVDVRIVAATNEDLPALARARKFRADLLDRLSFEVITLPPLRVREGDVAGPDTVAYLCGPQPMIDAATRRLLELGVPQDRIFSEQFVASN